MHQKVQFVIAYQLFGSGSFLTFYHSERSFLQDVFLVCTLQSSYMSNHLISHFPFLDPWLQLQFKDKPMYLFWRDQLRSLW
jgi:hypothetical protein